MKHIAGTAFNPGAICLAVASMLALAFLIAPIAIIVILSFSSSEFLTFPPPNYSLRWYNDFFGGAAWQRALWTSVKIGGLTMVFAALIGVPASLILVRGKFRGKEAVYAFLLSPMVVPTIITAIALYFLFAQLSWVNSIVSMALGHTVLALPIVIIILCATLQGLDPRLEQAALSLGASRLYTLRRITLPMISAGIFSAMLLAFLTSFDDLLIPLFLSGVRTETLSVKIWNSLRFSVDPSVAAVSTFLIGVTAAICISTTLLRRRRQISAPDE